jgi:hypothetical protein
MQNLEKRIATLEAKDTRPCRWVWRNFGETDAEARVRAGIAPDDNIIIFCWRQQDADL